MWNYRTLNLIKRSRPAKIMLGHLTIGGIIFSALNFGDVIARKSLGASAIEITLFTMLMPVMSFTSIYWGWYLVGRDQRPLIWISGIIGTLALFSGMFLTTFTHLFIISLIFFLHFAVLGTAQNRVFQKHIPSKETGGLFGLSLGVRMLVAAVLSVIVGWWLEITAEGWQQMFIVAGIAGIFSTMTIGAIPTLNSDDRHPVIKNNWIIEPWKKVFELLKRRSDYFRFEIAFMLYGIAFMMMLPVVPIYLVDDLKMGYGIIGIAKGAVFQLSFIVVVPIFGKLFDNSTPHRLSAWCFLIAALYPLILMLAKNAEGVMQTAIVITAFIVFGIAMSGVTVLWNLSSMRFSGSEDAGLYQSVHQAATGLRGLFAPFFGYVVMEHFGKNAAFLTAAGFWIIAALGMVGARMWDKKAGKMYSLRVGKE